MSGARFALGRVVQTRGAAEIIPTLRVVTCLAQHVRGDWGLVDDDDKRANEAALAAGDRLLSAYWVDPRDERIGRFWIITEADRSSTTVLLPEEY